MSSIHAVPYSDVLESQWKQVFASNDPFQDPFAEHVESRIVMYPTYGYHLTRVQYNALKAAIRLAGEQAFFLSVIEFSGDFLRSGRHWYCMMPDYEEYFSIPLVLENSLYSGLGTYGVIISHEDHALVGGKREWIETLKELYQDWTRDREKIKEDWSASMARSVLDATAERPRRGIA